MGAVMSRKQAQPSAAPSALAVAAPAPVTPDAPADAPPVSPKKGGILIMNESARTSKELNRRVSFQGGEAVEGETTPRTKSFKGPREISMKKIVDTMYAKILADPFLAPFFNGINMASLKHQQEKVMSFAFGGPELLQEEAPDMDMRKLHWRLIEQAGLNTDHWEAFVRHFEAALDDLGDALPAETREKGVALIRSTRWMFEPVKEGEVAGVGAAPAAPAAPAAAGGAAAH
mmetsp:Transcript_20285/g.51367  ORF Transcript_20285/g.51367 Transcript_20285/m.51367 type:complete len:231 (-) Transcript_20285:671-1363(-)